MINNHSTVLLLAAASFVFTFTCPAQQQQANTIGISDSTPWVNAYHYYNYYEQRQMDEAGFVGLIEKINLRNSILSSRNNFCQS